MGAAIIHLIATNMPDRAAWSWFVAVFDGPIAVAHVFGLPGGAVPLLVFLYYAALALFCLSIIRRATQRKTVLAVVAVAVVGVHIGSVLLVAYQAAEGYRVMSERGTSRD